MAEDRGGTIQEVEGCSGTGVPAVCSVLQALKAWVDWFLRSWEETFSWWPAPATAVQPVPCRRALWAGPLRPLLLCRAQLPAGGGFQAVRPVLEEQFWWWYLSTAADTMVGFSESPALTSINLPACLTGGSLANTWDCIPAPKEPPCSQGKRVLGRAQGGPPGTHGDTFAMLSLRTTTQELKWQFRSFPKGAAPSPALLRLQLSAQQGKEEREQLKEGILAKRGRKWLRGVGWPTWASPAQDRNQPEGKGWREGC